MAEFLSTEVTGLDELRTRLGAALAGLEKPSELMLALGDALRANISRRFETKTDPLGQRWADLRPATVAAYRRADTIRSGKEAGQVKRRGTLLERTGQMRASLAVDAGDDWVEVGMSRLTDGGKWQIPMLHEHGTTRMARRGIFFADPAAGTLGADDEATLDEELTAFLDELFGPT